jgi:prepilin-type processing-associated H-X9-DG protein
MRVAWRPIRRCDFIGRKKNSGRLPLAKNEAHVSVGVAMSRTAHNCMSRAFTFVELLFLVAVIAVLAGLLLPPVSGASKARNIMCTRNLKELGESFTSWSQEHGGFLPMQVSTTNGGSKEFVESGSAVVHFLILTNSQLELVREYQVPTNRNAKQFYITRFTTNYGLEKNLLVCPSDKSRRQGMDFKSTMDEMDDTNISYFVGVDASQQKRETILAGDRHLLINGKPAMPGLVNVSEANRINWSTNGHILRKGQESGNILFADGHVETVSNSKLQSTIMNQPAHRLAVP